MFATFLRVAGHRNSVPPRLSFRIRLQGLKNDDFTVFMLSGFVSLLTPDMTEIDLGHFHPRFETFIVNPTTSTSFDFYLDFDENKRRVVEKWRANGDVSFRIWLGYHYYRLGKTPKGSERVKSIASNGDLMKTAEGSTTIMIEQSRWNKVLDQLGYRKKLLFELPVDFEEILSQIPKHPQKGLVRRVEVASKSFKKALNELRIGKWRNAVVESRKVYEAFRKGKLENGKSVKDAIQEMMLEHGLPKQNRDNITNIIDNLWKYTSPTHHIIDDEGNTIKEDEPTVFGREDAYLTVTTGGLLIKMLIEKLTSKLS